MPAGGDPTPGGGGDPHLSKFNGTIFDFAGEPYTKYTLHQHGTFKVEAMLTPGPSGAGAIIGVLYLTIGSVLVQIDTDGHVRVESPSYDLNIHQIGCSLPSHIAELVDPSDAMNGVACIDFRYARFPGSRTGETGAIVDGDTHPASDYVSTENPPP